MTDKTVTSGVRKATDSEARTRTKNNEILALVEKPTREFIEGLLIKYMNTLKMPEEIYQYDIVYFQQFMNELDRYK